MSHTYVVEIRLQPAAPGEAEVDSTTGDRSPSELDGEQALPDGQNRSILLKIQDEIVEAPLFGALSRFLRLWREKAKARKELEQRRQKEKARIITELSRTKLLRQRDPMVDLVLKSLVLAKLELRRMLDGLDESALRPEGLEGLLQWKRDHAVVMDFFVFEAICEYFPSPDEADPVLEIGEIRELLEEHCDALTCLGYADEKLEIQRGFEHWDDVNICGVRYERPDGRYEDVNRRLDRILRGLTEAG